jgi:acylphosphatase
MSSRIIGKKILIFGRVQGVFFRKHAKAVADELGVFGWIRNVSDGSVQVFVLGKKDAVDKFVEWCRNGPDAAEVERVEVSLEDLDGDLNSFEIIDS